ncbi:MAG: DNA-3-methyladenine glycosylase [Ferruginibacter sp.]
MNKLPIDFYNRKNVVEIARELIGKIAITNFDGVLTSGTIVETEAYAGIADKASHAYAGRRTPRNEHMYAKGGTTYIYICYGIHQMFNIVTNESEIPDAVLIRALEPIEGIEIMLERTGKKKPDHTLTRGPGNVGRALGMNKSHSGLSLTGNEIFIASDDIVIADEKIGASKRIGVAYAEMDAMLPYRFYLKGNKYVSGKPNQ